MTSPFSQYLVNTSLLLEIIKDTARPSYWVPDAEAPNCALCSTPFGTPEELDKSPLLLPQVKSSPSHDVNCSPSRLIGDRRRHHCRACGKMQQLSKTQ